MFFYLCFPVLSVFYACFLFHFPFQQSEQKMRLKKITALFLTGALILSMAGCAGNGSKDKKEGSAGNEAQEPVKIATKPMTEQFILGEMLKKLIEEKAGYEVELTKGIGGGTSNIQPAMEKGEFDLYPEYTSSGWILVLGQRQVK